MSSSFTVFWTNRRCQAIASYAAHPLSLLFGGPHTSQPRFSRYGVQEEDHLYPVRLYQGIVYVLGHMQVHQILPLNEYIRRNPARFAAHGSLERYVQAHPALRALAGGCIDEVVVGDGTSLRFDIPIPSDLLERLRFQSQKRERGLKHIVDGRLTRAITLQGIYRLTEPSAREIDSLLRTGLSQSLDPTADPD